MLTSIRGTKGDNGAAKDLGGAKKVQGEGGKELMEVELPTAREDVDQLWSAARSSLRNKAPEEREHRDAATKQADHDKNSRTNVVLAWVGTNMFVPSISPCSSNNSSLYYRLMIVVFTSTAFTDWVKDHVQTSDNTTFNPYLTFLFIALYVSSRPIAKMNSDTLSFSAGLSAIRFTGSFLYLVFRLFGF